LSAGEPATQARGALPLSYANHQPRDCRWAAGLEPATTRLKGEVTQIFTTGKKINDGRQLDLAVEFGVPSLRSGFRQQAPASLTPANRLNFTTGKKFLCVQRRGVPRLYGQFISVGSSSDVGSKS